MHIANRSIEVLSHSQSYLQLDYMARLRIVAMTPHCALLCDNCTGHSLAIALAGLVWTNETEYLCNEIVL